MEAEEQGREVFGGRIVRRCMVLLAQNEKEGKEMLNDLEKGLEEYGMKMSVKIKCMVISSRHKKASVKIFLCVLLLWGNVTAEGEKVSRNQSTTETSKSEITKREEPEAQRREHSFNPDGTVNYHGSGSGHDSGDLVPPPGGSVFNSPSIEISVGHTGASGPGLSNSYGLPIPDDTYGPPKPFFNDKPSGFYGPPSQQYGPPTNKYLPSPPKPVYGPPKPSYRPPSPPKPVYGPPALSQFRPPKTSYSPVKPIRSKPSFSSRPKPVYGPPKDVFGSSFGTLLSPVAGVKTQYGPPKISPTYGTPLQPSTSYGVPKHGKHGHGSAPPTPPVVKYDGWKPIPGLVSNAPSSAYGAPDNSGHGISSGQGISSGHGVDFSTAAQISGGGFDGVSTSYGAPSFGGTSFGSSGFGISQPGGSFGIHSKPSISYGTPLQPSTSYGPPSHKSSSKLNILSSIKPPSPSYGVPEPSISQHPPKPSHSYGPPKAPSSAYGPPKSPSISYGPPKAPSISYGPPRPPIISFGPPKAPSSSYGPPKSPSSSYGPPSLSFGSFSPPTGISSSFTPPKIPSSVYGPPKAPSISYGPPKAPSISYGPPKAPSTSYGPPKAPSSSYGPPKPPSSSYGPPKLPSSSYGPPKPVSSSYGPPQIFTTYSIPKPSVSASASPSTAYRGPPVPHPLQPPSTYGPPSFQGGLYKTPLPPNALYGVPTAPASGAGCCGSDTSWQFQSNTYGAPLPDLHAPGVQSVPSIELNSQFLSTGPSPLFPSAPIPSTSYGTPLLPSTPASVHHSPASTYGVPTALPLRQPKNPVKFRPPVPAGLISSIGAKWGDSAVWGGGSHSQKFHANTYIPPAVPDPDPGIQANKGNPLVIPPPSAPPINYGPPPSNHEVHGQVSNQFASTVTPHSSGEDSLYPPPPPPPPPMHGQGSFDIQQSASVELPTSNTLDHQAGLSTGGVTSYNAPIDTTAHQQPTAPSVNQDFTGGIQNIPIKGTQGSYTLQIQAAGGNSGEHVPHNEVLSNGLLQDILAAIENPSASEKLEQYAGPQPTDPVASEIGLNILKQLGGTNAQQSNSIQLPTQYGSDLSHSSSSNVPLYSQSSETSNEVVQIPSSSSNASGVTSDVKIGNYLSENKIAFYYNNQEGIEERKGEEKDILLVQMLLPNNSTSSESEKSEFGALVSIKIQNAQNGGEVDSRNATVTRGDEGS